MKNKKIGSEGMGGAMNGVNAVMMAPISVSLFLIRFFMKKLMINLFFIER